MRIGGADWMNAQKQRIKIVQNADARAEKGAEMMLFRIKNGTRAGKGRGAGSGPGAVGKWMGKDNFSGGKKSF